MFSGICSDVFILGEGVESRGRIYYSVSFYSAGFSPAWDDELTFKLHVPDLVLVHFGVYTKDSFIAQFTLPFSSILQGLVIYFFKIFIPV